MYRKLETTRLWLGVQTSESRLIWVLHPFVRWYDYFSVCVCMSVLLKCELLRIFTKVLRLVCVFPELLIASTETHNKIIISHYRKNGWFDSDEREEENWLRTERFFVHLLWKAISSTSQERFLMSFVLYWKMKIQKKICAHNALTCFAIRVSFVPPIYSLFVRLGKRDLLFLPSFLRAKVSSHLISVYLSLFVYPSINCFGRKQKESRYLRKCVCCVYESKNCDGWQPQQIPTVKFLPLCVYCVCRARIFRDCISLC